MAPTRTLRRLGPPLLVFSVALALRLLYLAGALPLLEQRRTPILGDAAHYYLTAAWLLDGDLRNAPVDPIFPSEPSEWSDGDAHALLASRGPGYPLFLAACFALFGERAGPVRALQALLGSLGCAIVCLLGREVGGARVALVAGLLAAVHPSGVLMSERILTETLAGFLFASALCALAGGRSAPRLALAGLLAALAALTRPTLLATLPFLLVCVLWSARRAGERIRAVRAFGLALLGPVLLWSAIASAAGMTPVAGGRGLEVFLENFRLASAPELRGWRPDGFRPPPPAASELLLQRVPAAANLVFVHSWFLDDLWREIPSGMHALQRAIAILAILGAGFSLARRRGAAILLPPFLALGVVSLKWIEIRPVLPLLCVPLVLSALALEQLAELVRSGRSARRAAALLAWGGCSFLVVLVASRPLSFAGWLPAADPLVVGALSDGAVVASALVLGLLLYRLARPAWGRRAALIAGLVPTLSFAALFAAYAGVGSSPRWRAFRHELRPGNVVRQELELRTPLAGEEMVSALWLVDLSTPLDPPPVAVAIDGQWLLPERTAWKRLFCARRRSTLCEVYTQGFSAFTGAYPASPQWWGVDVDPAAIAGRDRVSLSLALREPWRAAEPGAVVGGALSPRAPGLFYGPSPGAIDVGPATSLYRWHVLHDWRLWRTTPVTSRASRSRLWLAPDPSARDEPRSARGLAALLARGDAHWNVRLRVTYRGGRVAVF